MNIPLKIAALWASYAAQRVAARLTRAAGVPWGQEIIPCTGPWCLGDSRFSARGRKDLYHCRFGEVSKEGDCRIERIGPLVLAVGFSPDGGGEAFILRAKEEIAGVEAEEMRAAYERLLQEN